MPKVIGIDQVSEKYRRAIQEHGQKSGERLMVVNPGADLEAVMKNFILFPEENGHAEEARSSAEAPGRQEGT